MARQIHIISTGQQPRKIFIDHVRAVQNEVDFIHIRERSWTAREMIDTVHELVQSGISLRKIIINDRVDVAVSVNARGVQLPSHGIDVAHVKQNHPHLLLGCSVHSVDEAIEKEKSGADFLVYGHIFKTKSKPGVRPRGLKGLINVIDHVSIPVIALGGITPSSTPSVLETGAHGIAVLSGVLLAENPVKAVTNYQQAMEGFI